MLKVHHKYEQMIAELFKNDPLFLSALDRACASVINKRINDKQQCRSAELVAKYCDSLLKKSKTTEIEIDSKLSSSITIFKYIEDKDVYQKFYSRMLAKRLIHEQSQSMDTEEAMINRLKVSFAYRKSVRYIPNRLICFRIEFYSKLVAMSLQINCIECSPISLCQRI